MVSSNYPRRVLDMCKKSVLVCQLPPVPCEFPPGTYTFVCPQSSRVPGHLVQYDWNGHDWKRLSQVNHVDPISDPYLEMKVQSWLDEPLQVMKKSRKMFSFSKNLPTSQLIVPKRGFVPLENLNFELNLRNCGRIVGNVTVELVQQVMTFDFHDGWNCETTILVEKRFMDCRQFVVNGDIYLSGEFLIPRSILPSVTRGADGALNVQVSYSLKYRVGPVHRRSSLSGEVAIIIGRLPNGSSRTKIQNFYTQRNSSASMVAHSLNFVDDNLTRRPSIQSTSSTYKSIRRFLRVP